MSKAKMFISQKVCNLFQRLFHDVCCIQKKEHDSKVTFIVYNTNAKPILEVTANIDNPLYQDAIQNNIDLSKDLTADLLASEYNTSASNIIINKLTNGKCIKQNLSDIQKKYLLYTVCDLLQEQERSEHYKKYTLTSEKCGQNITELSELFQKYESDELFSKVNKALQKPINEYDTKKKIQSRIYYREKYECIDVYVSKSNGKEDLITITPTKIEFTKNYDYVIPVWRRHIERSSAEKEKAIAQLFNLLETKYHFIKMSKDKRDDLWVIVNCIRGYDTDQFLAQIKTKKFMVMPQQGSKHYNLYNGKDLIYSIVPDGDIDNGYYNFIINDCSGKTMLITPRYPKEYNQNFEFQMLQLLAQQCKICKIQKCLDTKVNSK